MGKDRSSRNDNQGRFLNSNAGTIAAIPAFLLCSSALVMLVLDVLMPGMSARQYVIYPILLRIVSLVSILCMAVCIDSRPQNGGFRIGIEKVFFILFAVCMIISTLVNGISHDAIFSRPYRYVGVYDLIVFIFIYMYCSGREWRLGLKRTFFMYFMLVADLTALAFFYNTATGRIAAFNGKLEPAAIFFHGNHYGYFLVMVVAVAACCLVLYEERTAVIGAVSLIFGFGALALNRSMGCILAACGMVLILLIVSLVRGGSTRRRMLIITAVMIAGAAAAIIFASSLRKDIMETAEELLQILKGENNIYAGNGRWGIWQYTIGYIRDYPWWGYGCEGISDAMLDYALTSNPHCEPLTYAAFFGVPAALFYTAGVITSVIKGLRRGASRDCTTAAFAALGYFLSSLFGVAMFYTAPFLFVFLGMASCGKRNTGSDDV